MNRVLRIALALLVVCRFAFAFESLVAPQPAIIKVPFIVGDYQWIDDRFLFFFSLKGRAVLVDSKTAEQRELSSIRGLLTNSVPFGWKLSPNGANMLWKTADSTNTALIRLSDGKILSKKVYAPIERSYFVGNTTWHSWEQAANTLTFVGENGKRIETKVTSGSIIGNSEDKVTLLERISNPAKAITLWSISLNDGAVERQVFRFRESQDVIEAIMAPDLLLLVRPTIGSNAQRLAIFRATGDYVLEPELFVDGDLFGLRASKTHISLRRIDGYVLVWKREHPNERE